MGGFVGLDYAAVRAGLVMTRIRITPELFAGIQVMERAALPILNDPNATAVQDSAD